MNRFDRENQPMAFREARWDRIQRARETVLKANGFAVG